MLNNKTILITGGTGSFGKRFIKTALEKYKPKKIIVYSRDEFKQYQMKESFKNKSIRYFIGDVRDVSRLELAMENVDVVIHTAALKQVPATEYNPFEAVKTNVIGAQNVIEAARKCNVKKIIALSTDKATAPINLYGATKLTSDKIFVSANNYLDNRKIKFSVVRYGNVMGSRGSVIPFFLEEMKKNIFPITDKKMTRFNITLQHSVDFVLQCLNKMWGGEIFIPKIPSYRILDLAKAISPNAKLRFVGIRPGEKLHEEMITVSDSMNTIEFDEYYVILPNSIYLSWDIKDFIKKSNKKTGKYCKYGFSYASNTNKDFLSVKEIRKLILDEVPGGKILDNL